MQYRPCASAGIALTAAMAVLLGAGRLSAAVAQEEKPAAKSGKAGASPKLDEDLVLRTRDGLQLALTYYPSAVNGDIQQGRGRKTIPIVLLHGLKQSRNDYRDLAHALQKLGHAVIVPDLRGHGESVRRKGDSRDETLNPVKMAPNQFGAMVTQDMRAIKDFLWQKNNAGELNIDKLCVVGADMGASVALNFAFMDVVDQERNPVPRPDYKTGRFVKALVLISPELSFRGLPTRKAASYPPVQRDISVMIVVGKKEPKALSEAKRIHGIFAKSHPEPVGDDRLDKQTLILKEFPTALQGTRLLDPKFKLPEAIADFVERRLMKSEAAKDWTWRERKFPYE